MSCIAISLNPADLCLPIPIPCMEMSLAMLGPVSSLRALASNFLDHIVFLWGIVIQSGSLNLAYVVIVTPGPRCIVYWHDFLYQV